MPPDSFLPSSFPGSRDFDFLFPSCPQPNVPEPTLRQPVVHENTRYSSKSLPALSAVAHVLPDTDFFEKSVLLRPHSCI